VEIINKRKIILLGGCNLRKKCNFSAGDCDSKFTSSTSLKEEQIVLFYLAAGRFVNCKTIVLNFGKGSMAFKDYIVEF
jgi:hypothetical protein